MLLTVVLSLWEVECCQPAPVFGEVYSLPVQLRPVPESPPPLPGIVSEVFAVATPLPPWDSGLATHPVRLTTAAAVLHYESPVPLQGRVTLRGILCSGWHGFTPPDTPLVEGKITRLQLLFSRFRYDPARQVRHNEGAPARLEDVGAGPYDLLPEDWDAPPDVDTWEPVDFVLGLDVR